MTVPIFLSIFFSIKFWLEHVQCHLRFCGMPVKQEHNYVTKTRRRSSFTALKDKAVIQASTLSTTETTLFF